MQRYLSPPMFVQFFRDFPSILFVLGFAAALVFPNSFAFLAPLLGLCALVKGLVENKTQVITYVKQHRDMIFFLCALVVLVALSLFWSIDFETSLERLIKLLPVLGLGFFAALLWVQARPDVVEKTLSGLIGVWLGGLILINFELFFDMPLYRALKPDEFFYPSYMNRQIAVLTIMFFLLFPIVLRMRDLPGRNWLKFLLAFLTATLLIQTESQGSQLSFFLGTLFLFFFPSWWKAAWISLKSLLVAGTILSPWIALSMFNFAEIFLQYEWFQHGYAGHRLEIWHFVSLKILENPLYGFGIEATRIIEDFKTDQLYFQDTGVLHPHNFALQLWIEFGLIGAVLGSVFLWHIVTKIQTMPDQIQRSALPFFMGIMVIAATGYGLWQGWWLGLFFMAGSLLALVIRYSRDKHWIV